MKLPEISQLHVYGGIVVRVLVHFFFIHCRSFSPWWPPAFLIFSPPLKNFHVVLPTKNVSFAFYLSLLLSVTLFLVELRWPIAFFSLFLCLSVFLYSKFVGMSINLSLIL